MFCVGVAVDYKCHAFVAACGTSLGVPVVFSQYSVCPASYQFVTRCAYHQDADLAKSIVNHDCRQSLPSSRDHKQEWHSLHIPSSMLSSLQTTDVDGRTHPNLHFLLSTYAWNFPVESKHIFASQLACASLKRIVRLQSIPVILRKLVDELVELRYHLLVDIDNLYTILVSMLMTGM